MDQNLAATGYCNQWGLGYNPFLTVIDPASGNKIDFWFFDNNNNQYSYEFVTEWVEGQQRFYLSIREQNFESYALYAGLDHGIILELDHNYNFIGGISIGCEYDCYMHSLDIDSYSNYYMAIYYIQTNVFTGSCDDAWRNTQWTVHKYRSLFAKWNQGNGALQWASIIDTQNPNNGWEYYENVDTTYDVMVSPYGGLVIGVTRSYYLQNCWNLNIYDNYSRQHTVMSFMNGETGEYLYTRIFTTWSPDEKVALIQGHILYHATQVNEEQFNAHWGMCGNGYCGYGNGHSWKNHEVAVTRTDVQMTGGLTPSYGWECWWDVPSEWTNG